MAHTQGICSMKDKFELKYGILLQKAYFDKGFGLLNYVKYIVGIIALGDIITNKSLKLFLIMGFFYAILCYVLGRLWFKFRWIEAENEVMNRYNLFQKEMRNKYGKTKS